jgi:hypothetical protein
MQALTETQKMALHVRRTPDKRPTISTDGSFPASRDFLGTPTSS